MIGKKVGDDRIITLAEVKEMLAAREKEGELHPEQKAALEHAERFSKLSAENTKKCMDELMKIGIPRFKEEHAVKLVDVLPRNEDLVKTMFSKENVTLKKEDVKKIMDVLIKYYDPTKRQRKK